MSYLKNKINHFFIIFFLLNYISSLFYYKKYNYIFIYLNYITKTIHDKIIIYLLVAFNLKIGILFLKNNQLTYNLILLLDLNPLNTLLYP